MPKLAGLICAMALAAAAALPAQAEDPGASTVVATVNGTDITLGNMIAMRETLPQQYLQLPDDVLFKGILEQLIQQVALSQIGEAEITPREKLDLENHRWTYLAGAVLGRVADAAVTDEALQKLFEEKYASAAPSKEYHAAHILVATEEEARALKAEIDAGGDFAAIAKAKSTDTGSAENGGDLGWFGLGVMVKPFEDAVIAAESGKVSDPVQTQFGWHIIKVSETRTAKGPTIDDVRDELVGDLQQKAVEAKVTELTAAADIARKADGIDPAILKQTDLIGQ